MTMWDTFDINESVPSLEPNIRDTIVEVKHEGAFFHLGHTTHICERHTTHTHQFINTQVSTFIINVRLFHTTHTC